MHRLALIALAGCGRVGFDSAAARDASRDAVSDMPSDVVPLGHDEDGDGIADSADTCPHVAGPQTDSDSDGVGDLCDPNLRSGVPDRIAMFFTMGAGDQPFTKGPDDAMWIQADDALVLSGDQGTDNNIFGHVEMPVSFGDVRVTVGMTVSDVLPVSGTLQNQIALAVYSTSPNYFVEMNQVSMMVGHSSITRWDGGTGFTDVDTDALPSGLHAGDLTFETTQRVNTSVTFASGWPGETYMEMVNDTLYQAATKIEMNMNNVHFEIRYLIAITSP